MAGADQGENSGLRAGRHAADSSSASGSSGPSASSLSAENAATQALPEVDARPVRAVARRPPTALPALGTSDSPRRIPRSARSTVDRRPAADRSKPTPEQTPEPAVDSPPVAAVDPSPTPSAPPGAAEPVAPVTAATEPRVAEPDVTVADGDGVASAPVSDDRVVVEVEEPSADVEVVEPAPAVPRPRRPVLDSLGDAQTAEMVLVERRPVAQLVAPRRGPLMDRPGPGLLDADTWEDDPGEVSNETYHGRRRAARPAARLWIVIGLVLLGLGVAVGIPMALSSSSSNPPSTPGLAAPSGPRDEGQVVPVPTASGVTASATSSASPATGSNNRPSRTVTPTASLPLGPPASTSSPTGQPPTTAPPTTTPAPTTTPPFAGLTIEAEASQNTVSASAARATYDNTSGGQLVGYIGKTFQDQPAGTLQFNNVTVPSDGTYTLTFHYIANSNRTAFITVNGAQTSVAVSRHDACCGTGQTQITLRQGSSNTIMFSNPTARCPAIDRIVITRP